MDTLEAYHTVLQENNSTVAPRVKPIKKSHLSIPSPKLRFARQLDGSRQQDVSKYLEGANSSKYKDQSSSKKFQKVCRKLTLQLLTS
jgi:hypothetical protein